jgi:hypothetical protein
VVIASPTIDVVRRAATAEAGSRLFARPTPAQVIFAFVAACALGKFFAAWATGFTGDESYTIVIARTLALSYFDHPPLHQWIVHGFATLFGEAWWVRAPFQLMAVAINVPLYGVTRRLFGVNAALWALFAFNTVPYFMAWPDGMIVPDMPLFLCLTAAIWAIAEILFRAFARQSGGLGALAGGRPGIRVRGLVQIFRGLYPNRTSLFSCWFTAASTMDPTPSTLCRGIARVHNLLASNRLELSKLLGLIRVPVQPSRILFDT